VKELVAAEEASSVFITTINKEKYRCSLPFISKTGDKASICVLISFHVALVSFENISVVLGVNKFIYVLILNNIKGILQYIPFPCS